MIVSITALVGAVILGVCGYCIGSQKSTHIPAPTQSRPGYIISQQASEQVADFYSQYIKPSYSSSVREQFVASYGSQNLVFYNSYYQHGFDPIVCSTVMPIAVIVAAVTPGPEAIVVVSATYPDHSVAKWTASVVIDRQGLRVDAITCPGNEGNLAPTL